MVTHILRGRNAVLQNMFITYIFAPTMDACKESVMGGNTQRWYSFYIYMYNEW